MSIHFNYYGSKPGPIFKLQDKRPIEGNGKIRGFLYNFVGFILCMGLAVSFWALCAVASILIGG